jgi:hypothetical protein
MGLSRFAEDRWPWLGGEALAEMILWDSSRHSDEHRKHLESLSRSHRRTPLSSLPSGTTVGKLSGVLSGVKLTTELG